MVNFWLREDEELQLLYPVWIRHETANLCFIKFTFVNSDSFDGAYLKNKKKKGNYTNNFLFNLLHL